MKQVFALLIMLTALHACGRKAPLKVVPGALIETSGPVVVTDQGFEDFFADPDADDEDDE